MIEDDTNLRTVIITALEKHLGGKATKIDGTAATSEVATTARGAWQILSAYPE